MKTTFTKNEAIRDNARIDLDRVICLIIDNELDSHPALKEAIALIQRVQEDLRDLEVK